MPLWIKYFWKWLSSATPIPIRVTEVTAVLLTLITLAVKHGFPNWEAAMTDLIWQVSLVVLIAAFIISIIWTPFAIYREQKRIISDLNVKLDVARKQAYPPITTLFTSQYFKSLDIPLGELGLVNTTLSDKTFENCRIHGPIIIGISNSITLVSCEFDGDPDITFIVTSNERVLGVLEVINCTFINCKFIKIGFIGNEKGIAFLKGEFAKNI